MDLGNKPLELCIQFVLYLQIIKLEYRCNNCEFSLIVAQSYPGKVRIFLWVVCGSEMAAKSWGKNPPSIVVRLKEKFIYPDRKQPGVNISFQICTCHREMENLFNDSNETSIVWANASNCSSSGIQPHQPTTVSASAIIKCMFLIVLFIINFVGNSLTVLAIRITERLHTNTNLMVAALAVDDLLIGFVTVFHSIWNLLLFGFGGNPCSFRIAMAISPPLQQWVFISAYLLVVVLALDR